MRIGKHDHLNPTKKAAKKQIRGEARENLIQQIGNKEFLAKNYRHEQITDGIYVADAPSEAVLRRINYESKHKHVVSNDWKLNLAATAKTYKIKTNM